MNATRLLSAPQKAARLTRYLTLLSGVLWSSFSSATCEKIVLQSQLAAGDGIGASWVGSEDISNGSLGLPSVISVTNNSAFQPDGTLLASANADFPVYAQVKGYNPEQVLFRCAAADAGQLFEMYATNGDNAFSGMYEDGLIGGNVPSGYATFVSNVVIRFTNLTTGQYYSRYWKGRPLTDLDKDSSGRLLVKAKNFSSIYTELFRIDYTRAGTYNVASYLYAYTQPNAYISFKGPGIIGPVEGTDSATNYPGWYAYWPASIGLYNKVTFRRSATCAVTNFTPTVMLPKTTVADLNSGATSSANFSVDFKCETGITSGVTTGTVAMGFLAPPANVAMATTLGLTNASGGVSHLLSDNYGNAGVAKGVGIRIYRNNSPIYLLSKSATLTGNNSGWYGIYQGAQQLVGTVSGGNAYSETFRAELGKLTGQTVTPGLVQAHAQVVIRVQ